MLLVVTLLHTLLTHPKLVRKNSGNQSARLINRVLLTVPVNTLVNWKAEFTKWIVDLPPVTLFDYSSTGLNGRELLAEAWAKQGGIMLITYDTLARTIKKKDNKNLVRILQAPGADGKRMKMLNHFIDMIRG